MPDCQRFNGTTLKKLVWSICLLFCLFIQSIYSQENRYTRVKDSIWLELEKKLAENAADTSFSFMAERVEADCSHDPECQYRVYEFLSEKTFTGRYTGANLFVSKKMLDKARLLNDPDAQGKALMNLYRIHSNLGYTPLAARNLEDALQQFREAGNDRMLLKAEALKLRERHSFTDSEKLILPMEAILERAVALQDTDILYTTYAALIGLYHGTHQRHKTLEYLEALESITPEKPVPLKTYWLVIFSNRMRAWIAEQDKQYQKAESYFLKALDYAIKEPSPWYEVDLLVSLFVLKSAQGESSEAKEYLAQAQDRALEARLYDQLSRIYKHKSELAAAEGRFEDAFNFKNQEHFYAEQLKAGNKGFNLESFYLEMEKEKLVAEKAQQEAELQLKATEARIYLLVLLLVLVLMAGAVYAYYLQRKAKEKATIQGALIQKQAAVLENLDAAKSRFFANVSHELRTPISLIQGPVNTLLKDENLTEKQEAILKIAGRNSEHLHRLVTEILDLSKLEAGKMQLHLKPVALEVFFRRHFLQFESLAIRRKLDFSFEILTEPGTWVFIDPVKSRQIINNLLSNAFKFTPPQGRVDARVSLHESNLQLEVADSGPGIHPDDLPYVFDRYFQTSLPDKPATGGTGIGLALCHEYAQLFGGRIEVESEPGKGSLFRLVFPVKVLEEEIPDCPGVENELLGGSPLPEIQGNFPDEGQNPAAAVPFFKDKATILVVEDNTELQAYIRLVLQDKYNIVPAENGQEALRLLSGNTAADGGHHFQLILTDLMMPVMDGYQLLGRLKSSDTTRHIPVIMLTARADVQDKLKALRLGVDDYLLKPFDEDELLVRIKNLLNNQARRKEFQKENESPEPMPTMSETDREWLESFEDYIQRHHANDILDVPMLASQFAMSESTLHRQLKKLTGLSPAKYLQEVRLHEARRLLETRRYNSIMTIALKTGFSDARSFSRSFKNRFGKLPSEIT